MHSSNIGYQDALGTHWVLQQHKKDPGRNEGYIKWNKEKSTENQYWSGWSWESNQQFGTQGRKNHSITIARKKKKELKKMWTGLGTYGTSLNIPTSKS